jgi:hypothetical protein
VRLGARLEIADRLDREAADHSGACRAGDHQALDRGDAVLAPGIVIDRCPLTNRP